MTSLNPSPLIVSMVQVATMLPYCLLALPAGALADIVDRRKLIIFAEVATIAFSSALAALVFFHRVTPMNLLLFTFLIEAGSAVIAPAWQAVVPQLVPKSDLAPAISANSAGVNVSRAVGPALSGAIIGAYGIAAPFWINSVSTLAVVGALVWWRQSKNGGQHLPPERFLNAIRAGLRHARYNEPLSATLMRAIAFFLFASAYWALLPLVARSQIAGGPEIYGVLLGAIGAGAVGGAFALPRLKAALDPDWLVAVATFGTAGAMALFGLAHNVFLGLFASLIAGVSWITVLSTLNISTQVALPEWVRGRGLSMFVTVLSAGLTIGSAIWGQVASLAGLPLALFIAAGGALIGIPLTWRWKLQSGALLDLTPSMRWPAPITTHEIERDRGPVLVTTEYDVDPAQREAFLKAIAELARERRRDGAYDWRVFEDPADDSRFVETFLVDSWLEHLRQHERVTKADSSLQIAVDRFQTKGAPKVTHLIAANLEPK
jgi:predicted MFS family arabinose efflux permease/quinol monooxygenase YgiN